MEAEAAKLAETEAAALKASKKESKLLRSWLLSAGIAEDGIRELASERLERLVKQHFDSEVMDKVIEGSEEPAWLGELLKEQRGRALLCELLKEYPSCVLLQFAVRQISEGEHASEVAGRSELQPAFGGQTSLPHFVGTLAQQVCAVLDGTPSAQLSLGNIVRVGEVQLLCAQLLLHALPAGAVPADTAGRLQSAAAAAVSAAAESLGMAPSHRLYLLAAGLARHSALMNCLISVFAAGAISAADAMTLAEHCGSGASAEVFAHPRLLQLLLSSLFDPSRLASSAAKGHLLHALAEISLPPGCISWSRTGVARISWNRTGVARISWNRTGVARISWNRTGVACISWNRTGVGRISWNRTGVACISWSRTWGPLPQSRLRRAALGLWCTAGTLRSN